MRHALLCAIGLIAIDGQGPTNHGPVRGHGSVHGLVFLDRNANGIREPGEPGLSGVTVSNQDTVVVTDSGGAFQIPEGPNALVFISEPDGYRSIGKFWAVATDSGHPMVFAMKRSTAGRTFTFVHASDTHLSPVSLPQTRRFRALVDSLHPDFVIVAGDLVRDALRVSEAEATGYYEMVAKEFGAFNSRMWLVPGNHENFGIETALSHVDPANPLFGRAMYHHYFGPDYYSFTRGGVHFVGLNSVDIDGTSYYGHVDSLQLAWLQRDLAHVPAAMPVVTFNHIPLVTSFDVLGGYTDSPPAPTLITVKGMTLFRHVVSNATDVLAVLRGHKHVLALGAHIHAGERITFINEGLETRFEQSPAVIGPSPLPPLMFPSGIVVYTVHDGQIDAGRFVPVSVDSLASRAQ